MESDDDVTDGDQCERDDYERRILAECTIAPGGQYSYTFPSAGTFRYHDSFNASMLGTVNVSGSSTSPTPY